MPEFLVGELVRQRMGTLSAAERRLAQVLLAFYPVAGLESLTRFAERAGVSPATVTRFITKLGLHGYPEFQDSLRQELQERLSSPLTRYELARPADVSGSLLRDAFATYEHSLRASVDMVSEHDFDAVIELLADSRRRVLSLGGRVSAFLARYLASQLHLIRPGVELIDPERSNPADHLVDLGRRDILVAFDFRRYQSDTINSAKVA
ncbi:MAG TPA: MurR/RpiR family transcriptional regulator, partial [Candidatus Dormibacteraeota bacterium]|nr:MurR/RpiR family transcriptional regulator [Candidatus Dormibacteraeota bacterium]